jgi:iron complex outermembrane receptor protein
MKRLFRSYIVFLLAAAAACSGAYGAEGPAIPETGATTDAQPDGPSGLAEIVVTAQKRSENLQDVPITVTALDADQLGRSHISSLNDLSTLVAGYQGPGDIGVGSTHIRGVGTAITATGNELAVATYIDGVFLPTNLYPPVYDFKDAAAVEVLKGPQGTLFGRNATGGLVNITTRSPGKEFEADGEVGYANYQTTSGFVYLGIPLSDRVQTGLAASALNQGQGWGTNQVDGREVGRMSINMSVRNKWLLQLSDNTDAMISLNYARTRGYCLLCFHPYPFDGQLVAGQLPVPRPWDLNSKLVTYNSRSMSDVTVRVTHNFGFARLTSISGYYNLNQADIDLNTDPTLNDTVHIFGLAHANQSSEELQLTSQNEGRLQWQTGLYYLKGFTEFNGAATIAQTLQLHIGSGVDIKSIAGYAQGTYALTDQDKLTLGARVTEETHDLVPSPLLIDLTGGKHKLTSTTPTWRVALDHQFTHDIGVYASVVRGFKSGGHNNIAVAVQQAPFLPESIISYEIGAKSLLFDRRLRLNASAFHYKYKDLQTQSLSPLGTEVIGNAATAKLSGVDVDFEALIAKDFTVTGTMEGLRSEYTSFPNADIFTLVPGGGASQTVGSATGNDLVLAPKFTASLSPNYNVPTAAGTYDLTVTYSYNAGYFASVDNKLKQPSYYLLGASVKYSSPSSRYWVELWGKNLTNQLSTSLLSFQAVGPLAMYNAPRTYGVQVGAKF